MTKWHAMVESAHNRIGSGWDQLLYIGTRNLKNCQTIKIYI